MKPKYKALLLAAVSSYALNTTAVAVDITGSPTINPSVDYPNATQFNILTNGTPTFIGDLNVPMVFDNGYNQIVTFTGGVNITAPISSLSNYTGEIIFKNGTIINNDIGTSANILNFVTFSADNNDSSILHAGNSIWSSIIQISGNDASTFNEGTINGLSNLNISDNAKPIFNDITTNATFLTISGNSAPIFNGGIIECNFIAINDNTTPTFNGTQMVAGIYGITVKSTPTITLGEGFSLDSKFSVGDVAGNPAAPKFKGKVNGPIEFTSYSNNVSAEFLEGTTITAPITTGTNDIGKLLLLENDITVADNLGSDTNRLYSVTFSSNSGTTVQAGKAIYTKYLIANNQDASVINSDIAVNTTMDIIDDASSIFNDGNINAATLNISNNSSPTFNRSTITSTDFNISNTSAPTFNGTQVIAANGINVFESPIITLDEGFTLDTKFNIHNNTTPTFKGTLMSLLELSDNSQTLNFDENVILKEKIATTVHKAGNVNFKGTASIENQIGSQNFWLGKVDFISDTSRKDVTLNKDIYSDKVKFKNVNIILNDNLKIQSGQNSLEIIDSIIDLKNKKLMLEGNNVITKNLTFKTTFDAAAGTGGNIVIDGATSRLDFSGSDSASVNIYGNTPLPAANSFYEYSLINTVNGGTVVPNPNINFTSSETNNLLVWTYDPATYKLKGVYDKKALPQIITEAGGTPDDLAVADFIANNDNSHEVLSNIGLLSNPAAQLKAIQGLQPVDQTSEQISENLDHNLSAVRNRIANLITPIISSNLSGIASGDAETRYGIWISPFVGSGLQKKNGCSPKFSSKFYGTSIGVDTAINDNLMLGAAITPMRTYSKFSEAKTGSKGEINTFLLSLYGYNQLNNNWYISGVICGGQSNVKQQERRILTTSFAEVARSSYNVKSFSTQFNIGYNHKLSDSFVVTPSGGLGYYWIDSASYTETGTTFTNLKVKKNSAYIAEATFGLQMAYNGKIKDTNVTPRMHVYVSYDFKRKENAVSATLPNFTDALPLSSPKRNKIYYNIGTDINVESPFKMFEYGASYEAELTKRSVIHTGAFKVKVLF